MLETDTKPAIRKDAIKSGHTAFDMQRIKKEGVGIGV